MDSKMNNNIAPKGYNTVCPYLTVESVESQIDFLQSVFNATVKEKLKSQDGIIQHGEVQIGDTVIMIGKGNKEFPAGVGTNYVYVKDVDETYYTALQNGSTLILEPADRFYGVRECGFKDPQGNIWWVAQFLKDVSVEEMEKGFAEYI
jgi:PhnB protein